MAYLSLRNVSVEFPIYQGANRSLKKALLRAGTGGGLKRTADNRVCVRALDNLTFDLTHGDRVGLVGSNGAGKTTLLRVLAQIYEPVSGQIEIEGRISPLFDTGLGLSPDATGYENIHLRSYYMGMAPSEVRARVAEVAAFTELGDYLNMPVRTYSSGMILRLAFAVATCVQPEILLMDEWMMAGDASFLKKARARMENFVSQSSIMVLATHSESLMAEWCNKAIYLHQGQVKMFGPTKEVLQEYAKIREAA